MVILMVQILIVVLSLSNLKMDGKLFKIKMNSVGTIKITKKLDYGKPHSLVKIIVQETHQKQIMTIELPHLKIQKVTTGKFSEKSNKKVGEWKNEYKDVRPNFKIEYKS